MLTGYLGKWKQTIAVMASQGNRIYADGILRKQKNGPHLCTIQIVGDELLVRRATESSSLSKLPLASIETASNASTASRAKSSASVAATPLPSPPQQQQQLLAKLNMKTLFHPTDPLLLERNGNNSVVIHRLSETGHDGLLLMFENTLLLDHFLHSISIFKKDRGEELESGAKNKKANVSGAPSLSRSSIGRHSTDTLTAASIGVVPAKQSPPRERQKKTEPFLSRNNSSPAAPPRPEWDSTPAGVYRTPQTPHATILFQSPSPVVPSATTSASARRGVRFDSESPPPTRTPPPDVPSRSASTGAAAIVSEESGQTHHHHRPGHNIISPSAGGYYSSSPFYRTGSLGGRTNDHSDGVFSARAAHQQQHQRIPSLSYLSTASSGAATAFSRTTSTHVDAYLDRSSRIQHYMDTIQQSTLERERLLEDLFEERDRKRRAYLRQAEYTAADDDIKASVKDRFARSQPDSFLSPAAGARGVAPHVATTPLSSAAALRHYHQGGHYPSPQPRTPGGGAVSTPLSSEQTQLVARLKGMLAEIPTPVAIESPEESPTPQHNHHEDLTLVDEIKRLLALEADFEALKYDEETRSGGGPSSSQQPGVLGNAVMDGAGGIIQSRYPHHLNTATGGMSNQPAQPIFETISATDLDAAVAAEARLMSTLRYGTIPIPKPSRPPLEAQTPSLPIASPAAGPRSSTTTTATLVSHNPTTVQNTVATPVVVVPPLVQNTAAAVAVQVLNRPSNGHETTSGGVSPLTPTSPMFITPFTQSVPAVPAASVSNNARDPRAQLPLDVPIQQQDKSIALEAAKGIATPQVTPAQPQPSSMTPSTTLSTPLWREVPDAASGKSYYVHKETRKTTWNRSETDLDSNSNNNNNNNTTVTPPVTPLAAPGQGWVAKQDPSSGKTFYFHPVTKKVTWKIAETLSASTEQQSPTGTVPLAAAAASSAVGPAAAAATTTVASPLGWIAKNDPSGKTYYSNSSLKKTTWKIEETDLDRNNAGSPKEQTSPSSSSASTATAPVPLATADGSPLPPNWKLVAPADGRSYYFNTITKKVQWTRPTE